MSIIAVSGEVSARDAALIKSVVAGIVPELRSYFEEQFAPLREENEALRARVKQLEDRPAPEIDLKPVEKLIEAEIAKLLANGADLQKLHYLFVLRNLRDGWTWEQRKFYFQWLNEARQYSGGASYQGFLNNIEKDAFENSSESETRRCQRARAETLIWRSVYSPTRSTPMPGGRATVRSPSAEVSSGVRSIEVYERNEAR